MSWSKLDIHRAFLRGLDLQGNNRFLCQLAVKCRNLHTLELHSGGELRQSLMDATSRARSLRNLHLGPAVPIGTSVVQRIMNATASLEVARFDKILDDNLGAWRWSVSEQPNLRELKVTFEPSAILHTDLVSLLSTYMQLYTEFVRTVLMLYI